METSWTWSQAGTNKTLWVGLNTVLHKSLISWIWVINISNCHSQNSYTVLPFLPPPPNKVTDIVIVFIKTSVFICIYLYLYQALWCTVIIIDSVCVGLVSCSSVSCAVCACVFSSSLTMTRNNSINKPPVTHIIRSSRVTETWRNQSYSRADMRFCAWAASGINSAHRQVQTPDRTCARDTGYQNSTRQHTKTQHLVFKAATISCVSSGLTEHRFHTHTCSPTHSLTHWVCTVRLGCMGPECKWPISALSHTHKVLCKETVMQHGDSTHTSTLLTSASHQMAKMFWETWLSPLRHGAAKSQS